MSQPTHDEKYIPKKGEKILIKISDEFKEAVVAEVRENNKFLVDIGSDEKEFDQKDIYRLNKGEDNSDTNNTSDGSGSSSNNSSGSSSDGSSSGSASSSGSNSSGSESSGDENSESGDSDKSSSDKSESKPKSSKKTKSTNKSNDDEKKEKVKKIILSEKSYKDIFSKLFTEFEQNIGTETQFEEILKSKDIKCHNSKIGSYFERYRSYAEDKIKIREESSDEETFVYLHGVDRTSSDNIQKVDILELDKTISLSADQENPLISGDNNYFNAFIYETSDKVYFIMNNVAMEITERKRNDESKRYLYKKLEVDGEKNSNQLKEFLEYDKYIRMKNHPLLAEAINRAKEIQESIPRPRPQRKRNVNKKRDYSDGYDLEKSDNQEYYGDSGDGYDSSN